VKLRDRGHGNRAVFPHEAVLADGDFVADVFCDGPKREDGSVSVASQNIRPKV
jgi:hypothetical protein